MSYLIIGANGSMGQRYQAILKHLGKTVVCADVETPLEKVLNAADWADGVILATPTETHYDYLRWLAPQIDPPILCEKPVTKSMDELHLLFDLLIDQRTNFTMMLQYQMLDSDKVGSSNYNYFRTGKDGLIWDCFQVIALARGPVHVDNTSPIWTCRLNGKALSLSDMDKAYVDFVAQWIERPGHDLAWLMDMHQKVNNYLIKDYQTRW